MPMPRSNRKIYSNTVIVFLKNKEQHWTSKGAADTLHLWNTSEYLEYLLGQTAINDTRLFRLHFTRWTKEREVVTDVLARILVRAPFDLLE